MITGEQLQFKDALLITYSNGSVTGKVCLKKDHENFQEIKTAMIEKLNADDMVYKCEDILYYSEANLQEYINN